MGFLILFSSVLITNLATIIGLLQRTYPHIPYVLLAVTLAGMTFIATRLNERLTLYILLSVLPVFPAIILLVIGRPDFPFVLWFLCLSIWCLSSRTAYRWHIPVSWIGPVTVWGTLMILACFQRIWILTDGFSISGKDLNTPLNRVGMTPIHGILLASFATAVLIGGFIWFNRIVSLRELKISDRKDSKITGIEGALITGLMVGGLIALYQAFIDLSFLNLPYWIRLRRVAGGALDANAHGIIYAVLGSWLMIRLSETILKGRWLWIPVGWSWVVLQVMVSGSRSGFLLLILIALYYGARALRRIARRPLYLFATVLICAVLLIVFLQIPVNTPLHRVIKGLSTSPSAYLAHQLKARINYGHAALLMFLDRPLVGVGPGNVHILMPDYGYRRLKKWLQPDNALNWYLHQLVVLGLTGLLAWVPLTIRIATAVIQKILHGLTVERGTGWLLAGFGVISLFGVHTWNAGIMVVFWLVLSSLIEPDDTAPYGSLSDLWKGILALTFAVQFALGWS